MGYPSAGQLIKQLQHGKIDTKVSPIDVVNSVHIFGKSLGECKGKTTATKQPAEVAEHIPFTGVRMWQTVYIDLMFIGKLTFIIVVADPLDYTFVGLLKSKSSKDIWIELRKILREITNRGFKIIKGYIDGERGTNNQGIQAKMAEELAHQIWIDFHIELDIAGASEAVPKVEAKIRRVKERMRAI